MRRECAIPTRCYLINELVFNGFIVVLSWEVQFMIEYPGIVSRAEDTEYAVQSLNIFLILSCENEPI